MNKLEMVKELSVETRSTQKDAEAFLDAFTRIVTKELAEGGKVQLVGFGVFEAIGRAARKGRNPKTGESIAISATKVPKFRAGKELKLAVK